MAVLLLSPISMSVFSAESNKLNDDFFVLQPDYLSLSSISIDNSMDKTIEYDFTNNRIHLSSEDDDWINTHTKKQRNKYSISTYNTPSFGNEVSVAWNFTKFFKINLNIFENQYRDDQLFPNDGFNKILNGSFDKNATNNIASEINRSITGYKFGISSELGLGNDYKLGLNLDYGQLEGADLVGFNSDEVATTSFALGIRKSKFGASVNTDIFLEENIDLMESSRLGFEIDWYFSDETKLSLGSKQRMTNTTTETSNSLDSLTGNVQYIKFQHNL